MPLSATRSVPRLLLLLLGCAVFVALGWWIATDLPGTENLILGWAAIVFFGIGMAVFVVQLALPKPRLTIDGHGVTWTDHSDQTIPWEAVADIGILRVAPSSRFLAISLVDPNRYPSRRPRKRPGPSLSTRMYGGDIHIGLQDLNTSAKAVQAAVDQYWPPR